MKLKLTLRTEENNNEAGPVEELEGIRGKKTY